MPPEENSPMHTSATIVHMSFEGPDSPGIGFVRYSRYPRPRVKTPQSTCTPTHAHVGRGTRQPWHWLCKVFKIPTPQSKNSPKYMHANSCTCRSRDPTALALAL